MARPPLLALPMPEQTAMSDPATLLTPEALAAPDWADRVLALLPSTLIPTDEEFEEDVEPREAFEALCEGLLAHPDAIAHPDWARALRAVIELSEDYRELTDDAYGEALDPDKADEDEGGVVDMLVDLGLSTIGDAFTLLAHPAAVARQDWPSLVRHVLAQKQARFGSSLFLSFGWEEADELFSAPHVRAHPEAPALWREAREILPLESASP